MHKGIVEENTAIHSQHVQAECRHRIEGGLAPRHFSSFIMHTHDAHNTHAGVWRAACTCSGCSRARARVCVYVFACVCVRTRQHGVLRVAPPE